MDRVVLASRSDVADLVCKLAVGNAEFVILAVDRRRQRTEVLGGENAALVELARVEGLIPPRQGPVEATLVAQQGLEGRDKSTVPGQENFVTVDGVGENLVSFREVLPPALGGGEVFAGRRLLCQARNGIYKGLAVASRVVAPFDTSGERSAACRIGSSGVDGGGCC